MALLLPYPEDVELTENDCCIVAEYLSISFEEAVKWGMERKPITIRDNRAADGLGLTVQFGACTYTVTERTFPANSESWIHRTYDTMKLLDPPDTLELYWNEFKIPTTKEVILTRASCHKFLVKNTSAQECTVKVLNGYWPAIVRENTTYHDGIQYSDQYTLCLEV